MLGRVGWDLDWPAFVPVINVWLSNFWLWRKGMSRGGTAKLLTATGCSSLFLHDNMTRECLEVDMVFGKFLGLQIQQSDPSADRCFCLVTLLVSLDQLWYSGWELLELWTAPMSTAWWPSSDGWGPVSARIGRNRGIAGYSSFPLL